VSTPVTTAAVRSWEGELAPGEVAFLEHVLGAFMQRYGYELSAGQTPVPKERMRAFTMFRRRKASRRLRERLTEAKLRVTYRRPVAARLEEL
jgi:hypothetical protein